MWNQIRIKVIELTTQMGWEMVWCEVLGPTTGIIKSSQQRDRISISKHHHEVLFQTVDWKPPLERWVTSGHLDRWDLSPNSGWAGVWVAWKIYLWQPPESKQPMVAPPSNSLAPELLDRVRPISNQSKRRRSGAPVVFSQGLTLAAAAFKMGPVTHPTTQFVPRQNKHVVDFVPAWPISEGNSSSICQIGRRSHTRHRSGICWVGFSGPEGR